MPNKQIEEIRNLIKDAMGQAEDFDEPTDGLVLDIAHAIVHADAIEELTKLDMLGTLLLFSNDTRDNLESVLKFLVNEDDLNEMERD